MSTLHLHSISLHHSIIGTRVIQPENRRRKSLVRIEPVQKVPPTSLSLSLSLSLYTHTASEGESPVLLVTCSTQHFCRRPGCLLHVWCGMYRNYIKHKDTLIYLDVSIPVRDLCQKKLVQFFFLTQLEGETRAATH